MEEKIRDPSATANAAAETVVVEAPRRRSAALKRKAAASNSSGAGGSSPFSPPPKRAAKEKKHQHHSSRPPVHNGPLTRARQSPNKFAASAAASISAAANPQKPADPLPAPATPATLSQPISAAGEPIPATEEAPAPDPIVDAEFEAVRSRSASAHVVPIPAAGWFSWTRVHPIEERSLPSFFNGKSEGRTPDSYLEIRNGIMKKFHADPQTMIELKHLSEMSVGDSDARQQVKEFLDHWGLINFHPFPPADSAAAVEASTADEERASKTACLIEKLYHFEPVQPHVMAGGPDLASPMLLPHLLPESAIADDSVRPEGPAVEYHCNSCSADCSRKRYHCQTQADFDLCSDCYSGGKFDSGMTPADFILMEHAEVPGASGGSWTDQETLLLLEALELYGENWHEIAEHVATKTRTQCILHFVQMPIEDSFLENEDDGGADFHVNNADPTLKNKDSLSLDVTEKMETESATNDGQPDASPADISKPKDDGSQENVDPGSSNKDSSALHVNDTTEIKSTANDTTELKSTANDQQPDPSPTNVSKPKPNDIVKVEVTQETGANFALNALKAAFQAVGSLPNQGGSLSFAEAGNPVMALASFLAGLVEPDVAAASARCSLKSISEDSPNIQLAARHCFLLEDPPDGKKQPPECESAVTDTVDGKAQKEENQSSSLKLSGESMACTGKEAVSEESLVNAKECKDKLENPGTDDLGLQEATPSTVKESGDSTLPGEVTPSTVKEPSDAGLKEEIPPTTINVKESADSSLLKDVAPSLVKESGDSTSQGENAQCSGMPKDVDIGPDSVTAEEEVPKKSVGSSSTVETGDTKGENDAKMMDSRSEMNCKSMESKEDHNIDRIKRAAVTALSAAAVKAKLLADQEEEQIRELVALLIEKQLHKLETKMGLFAEMDNAIMRVREQLERARQRVYHERAQIIAARLGLPTPASRPMPPSISINRTTANYVNTVSKPPTMASQKPQARRTLRTSNPPSSMSSFPSTASVSSTHDQSQNTLSSVVPNSGS